MDPRSTFVRPIGMARVSAFRLGEVIAHCDKVDQMHWNYRTDVRLGLSACIHDSCTSSRKSEHACEGCFQHDERPCLAMTAYHACGTHDLSDHGKDHQNNQFSKH